MNVNSYLAGALGSPKARKRENKVIFKGNVNVGQVQRSPRGCLISLGFHKINQNPDVINEEKDGSFQGNQSENLDKSSLCKIKHSNLFKMKILELDQGSVQR